MRYNVDAVHKQLRLQCVKERQKEINITKQNPKNCSLRQKLLELLHVPLYNILKPL